MESKDWHIDDLAEIGAEKTGWSREKVKEEIKEILDEPFEFAVLVYPWEQIPNTDAEYALNELTNRAQNQP